MLHNRHILLKKSKARKRPVKPAVADGIFTNGASYFFFRGGSPLLWGRPGNVHQSQDFSFIQLTFINPPSILMTPGKHPNPSAPGSSLCRQPHLTLRLPHKPWSPALSSFNVCSFYRWQRIPSSWWHGRIGEFINALIFLRQASGWSPGGSHLAAGWDGLAA